jgi:DNA (cytosine-5)-methyltransferase 1
MTEALLGSVGTRLSQGFSRDGQFLTRSIKVDGRVSQSTVEVAHPTSDDLGDWWVSYLNGFRPASEAIQTTPIRSAELFSGPGGLALGFERACLELGVPHISEFAVDQDDEAAKVYQANHNTRRISTKSVISLVDYQIRGAREDAQFLYEPEIVSSELEHLVGGIDVLLAGPPCQGYSNLNNRTRRKDRRNELYLTVPAMAVALQAKIVIIENVHAVLHDRLGVVDSTIALLKAAGYRLTSGVLHAAKMGWPQNRQRYFLIGRLDHDPIPLNVVAAALGSDSRPLWWAIGDLEDEAPDDFMNCWPELSEENRRRIDWLFDNEAHDLPPSERPDCHKNGTTYNAVYGRLFGDRPAPTITTGFLTPGRGRYIHPTRRRVLTPREAARLQGFPDTYNFRPDTTRSVYKNQLGKWIGDAVPMPLGYAAGISAIGNGWS